MKTPYIYIAALILMSCPGQTPDNSDQSSEVAVSEVPVRRIIPEGLPAVDIFPGKNFTKVIAYELNGRSVPARPGVVFEQQTGKEVVLKSDQVQTFLYLLNDPGSFGFHEMACFDPRIGLVFYDAEEEIVAYLSLCLACNNVRTEPALDLGLERPVASGFSKVVYRQLLDMFNAWGIPHEHQNPLMDE